MRKNNNLISTGLILTIIFFGLKFLWSMLKNKQQKLKAKEISDKLLTIGFDANWSSYDLEIDGYDRGCDTDRLYRKKWVLSLLKDFGNACAKCDSSKRGLDIDHFFIAKDNGGCFVMYHKNGYLVNNAIPLCQTCNRSKGKKYFDEYFNNDEIEKIARINCEITRKLNVENPDGNFVN